MLSKKILRYLDAHPDQPTLTVPQQFQSMVAQPETNMEIHRTKPRLGKDEVDILEREFERNPRPRTQIKRQFAEDMGVELSRINNWFQNRRAKRKQEKKQDAYKAGQTQETPRIYLEPSSLRFNYANLQINERTASSDFLSGSPNLVGAHDRTPSYFDRSRNGKSPEDCKLNSPTVVTAYNKSEPEQWSLQSTTSNPFSSPPSRTDIASRRTIGHKPAAWTAYSSQRTPKIKSVHRLPIFSAKSPEPFVEKDRHNIPLPPLTVGSFSNSSLPSPAPISPREKEIIVVNGEKLGLNKSSSDVLVFNESLSGSFVSPSAPWITKGHDFSEDPWLFPIEIEMSHRSLRAKTQPKPFQFSHTTPVDILEEYKPHPNDTSNAAEDRDEKPQPIKRDVSPTLNLVDEGRSVTHTIKVEEVTMEVEIDCRSQVSQNEDVFQDDICASSKTEHLASPYMKGFDAISNYVLENEHDDLILPILDPMQQDLIERIMEEFWLIFNQNWAAKITQYQGGCSSTPEDNQDSGTTAGNLSLPNSQQKRQRSREEDFTDESGNKKPRRQRGGAQPPSELNKLARFACPFRKHDPQRYSIHSHRVCTLTSWDTIARVKEHLYRNHKAAPHCKRCWKVFENEELLDSHATVPAISICEASPGNPPDGITPKQVVELRSKAKPYSKQNEADRWKDIFRLLFPDESIPSPYWEPIQEHMPSSPNSQILMRYDDYMHQELPRLFRSRVEELVRREMQPVESSLLANLEGLIRECQDQLSSGYRETQTIEQQSKASPIQPIETFPDPENQTNTVENLRMIPADKDQQPSSDFFDAVLRAPPLQEEDYVLDFSASDTERFDHHQYTSFGNLSDSSYVSVPRCSCKELCACLASMINFESPDVDTSEPSLVDITQDLEAQFHDVQWENLMKNRD